jgi:hypothetical protein
MPTHRARCDSVLRAQGCFDALDQPLPLGRAPHPLGEGEGAEDGQVGLHRHGQRRGRHTGQPRIFGLHGRIERARPLRIDAFRDELGKGEVAAPKVVGDGRADRTDPVDDSRTIRRHDHVVGVKVGMAQAVPRRQALDQGEDASGDVLRNAAGGFMVELRRLYRRGDLGGAPLATYRSSSAIRVAILLRSAGR